jgi:hypothetical protein
MIDQTINDDKNVQIEIIIKRAENAEENLKFSISSNHYFTLFSRYYNLLENKPEIFKNCVDSFVYNVILLPVGSQKERMLNFILKNETLNVFAFKPFLEKM